MRKGKLILFILVAIIILLAPAIIFAVSKLKEPVEYLAIGDRIVEVSKDKTREDWLLEKELATIEPSNSEEPNNSNSDEQISDDIDNEKTDEKYVLLEQNLINLAEKYNRKEEYESLKSKIEKQNTIGVVTEEHEKICEIFMDIYKNKDLTDEEKQYIEDFLEMILFNDVDEGFANKIKDLIY